jgi:plastocyanin
VNEGGRNNMTRIATLITSLLLSAAVLIACGGSNKLPPPSTLTSPYGQSPPSPSVPNSPGAQAADSQIIISNMTYTVPTSVRPGQQLTIVNQDDPNHTVTADENNLFDVRVSGGGGIQSFTAPMAPGTYPVHCKYHANMHGLLTVQ